MTTPEQAPWQVLDAYLERQKRKAEIEAELAAFRKADDRDNAAFALLVPYAEQRRFRVGVSYAHKFVCIYHSPAGIIVKSEEYEVMERVEWPEPPSDVIDVEFEETPAFKRAGPDSLPAHLEARGSINKPSDEDEDGESSLTLVASVIDSEVA